MGTSGWMFDPAKSVFVGEGTPGSNWMSLQSLVLGTGHDRSPWSPNGLISRPNISKWMVPVWFHGEFPPLLNQQTKRTRHETPLLNSSWWQYVKLCVFFHSLKAPKWGVSLSSVVRWLFCPMSLVITPYLKAKTYAAFPTNRENPTNSENKGW